MDLIPHHDSNTIPVFNRLSRGRRMKETAFKLKTLQILIKIPAHICLCEEHSHGAVLINFES